VSTRAQLLATVAADFPTNGAELITAADAQNSLDDMINSSWIPATDGTPLVNPLTTLGDMIYGGAAGATTRLAGNTSATMAVLTQTGTGAVSAAPVWTSTTGTGNVVRANTPTLVTPVLGAATYTTLSGGAITDSTLTAGRVTFAGVAGLLSDAASFTFNSGTGIVTATGFVGTYNGNTFTTGTGTLTIAAGKVLTVSNTLTFTGTDGSSVAFGTGGTVLYSGGAYVSSITGTAGQITASAATGAVTLSIPSAMTGINSITSVAGQAHIIATGTSGTAITIASATNIVTFAAAAVFPDAGFTIGAATPGTIAGSAGSLTFTASGTNQSITLTPSGTGGVSITGSGSATLGLLRFPNGTTVAQGAAFGTDTFFYKVTGGELALTNNSNANVSLTATQPVSTLYSWVRLANSGGTATSWQFGVGGSGTANAGGFFISEETALGSALTISKSTGLLTLTKSIISGGPNSMTITAGTGNSRTLTLQSTTSGGTATTGFVMDATQGITLASLAGTGSRAVLADANGLLSAPVSDETWKENMRALPDSYGLATVMALRPLIFNYRDKSRFGAQDYIGFGARETATILKEITGQDRDGTYYITEEKLGAVAVKAIQQLKAEVDQLRAQLAARN